MDNLLQTIAAWPEPAKVALTILVVLIVFRVTWALMTSGRCPRCGWTKGSDACRTSHGRGARNEATRMWTKAEWRRYQATGQLPKWDHSRERGQ